MRHGRTSVGLLSAVVALAGPLAGAEMDRVEPSLVSANGGTRITVHGSGFAGGQWVQVGSTTLKALEFDPAGTWIEGTTDPLPVGRHDVQLHSAPGPVIATLPDGVESALPPGVRGVTPSRIPRTGGVAVEIRGANLRDVTEVRFGAHPVLDPRVSADGTRIDATAPALTGTEPDGFRDVRVSDSRGSNTLAGGVEYFTPAAAEIASFEPVFLEVGGGTEVEVRGSGFREGMTLHLEGEGGDVAVPFELAGPTVLRGTAPARTRGKVDAVLRDLATGAELSRLRRAADYVAPWAPSPQSIEATLVGGIAEIQWQNPVEYAEIDVYRNGTRIATLPGTATTYIDPAIGDDDGAGYTIAGRMPGDIVAKADFDVYIPLCVGIVPQPVDDLGDTIFSIYGGHDPHAGAGDGGGAAALALWSGRFEPIVIDPTNHLPIFQHFPAPEVLELPNELVTGFTLLQDAHKVRVEIHGAKVLGAPDLSLRVLLESVTPGVERAVELTMPDVLISAEHRWMELTYNTEHPDPQDPGRVDPPLPAADYIVKVYAVGGELGQSYFTVSSDFSTDQIYVPGVGCPPYPMIRVTDTTGRNSNPQILGIEQFGESQEFLPLKDDAGNWINTVLATLRAKTFDPDGDPIVSYDWKVVLEAASFENQFQESADRIHTASDTTMVLLPDYGYYFVELTVKDRRCGIATRQFVVRINPPMICPVANNSPNFTYPSPKPNNLFFVPNLPGNIDSFFAQVPAEFRIFVVDEGACQGGGAKTKAVQLAIMGPPSVGNSPLIMTNGSIATVRACLLNVLADGTEDCVLDPDLAQDQSGARFWRGVFPDMGRLPDVMDPVLNKLSKRYRLMARASTKESPSASDWGPWKTVRAYDAHEQAIAGSEVINMRPKPPYLNATGPHTAGTYEKDSQRYVFTIDMGAPGSGGVQFPDAPGFDLPLPGGEFPTVSNNVTRISQRATLSMQKGVWSLEDVTAAVGGTVFNGRVDGGKRLSTGGGGGSLADGGGAGASEGFDPATLSYDYCDRQELYRDSFETSLFNSIIYAGSIGPVQVTVTASVSLGVGVSLETQTEMHLRGLDPERPFEAHYWLLPEADVSLGAAVRADIFFGIVSVEGGADFATAFKMPVHLGANKNGLIGPDAGLEITVDLDLWFEACVHLLLADLCLGDTIEVLDDKVLLSVGNADMAPEGCGAGASLADVPDGAGADLSMLINTPDHQLTVASSPNGQRQVAVGVFDGPMTGNHLELACFTRVQGEDWKGPPSVLRYDDNPGEEFEGLKADPKVVFVSNDRVLLAWTQSFANEDPELDGIDPTAEGTPEIFNKVTRRYEVVYRMGTWVQVSGVDAIDWGPVVRLSDDPADALRADGRVSLAAVPGSSAAWAAWVRYETSDMVAPDGKVRMRQTSIYARQIANGQPVAGTLARVSDAVEEIDIEPTLAIAQDGTVMVAWVNDPVHDDLLESNRDRNLLWSRRTQQGWTVPMPVIADATSLPGILEPSLALKSASYGMLAFTALPANAAEDDSGLHNTRMVYTAKLVGGVWQAPLPIYRKCDTPLYAHWPTIHVDVPPLESDLPLPDFTVVMQELGPLGTRAGAGNVLAATYDGGLWSYPIDLTPDDRIHKGFAATLTPGGEIVILDHSPAPASRKTGGPTRPPAGILIDDIMTQNLALAADPAISRCHVSDAAAGPGSKIEAEIGVVNNGLAGTPVSRTGESQLMLLVEYLDAVGDRVFAIERNLPAVQAGAETFLTVPLTVPREPVRLRVSVDPVSGERNAEDNVRECWLGAAPPRDLGCRYLAGDGEEAVVLEWTNASLYDSILVYRDGRIVAEVPGSSTRFIDRGPTWLHRTGVQARHEYALRSRVGESRSARVLCEFSKETAGALFRRGDSNSDGQVDISDASFTLSYLFLGGAEPSCETSADANDDASVDITDAIFTLTYLFLGGAEPPAPGPEACGLDPTADELGCAAQPSCP